MENIIDELVKIHNENFKNKVGDKYFSEMMLGEQYEIYCLFNFMGENIFVKKLKAESRKEDENFGKKQKEKTNFDKNEKNKKNVLGYVVFYGTIESTDIFELAIEKKYQGRGFGEILMTESMGKLSENRKNLKENDLSEKEKTDFSENKFLLEVNEKNVKALKLYKKIGFEEISIRKNYYGKDENAVIMIKYY
ncbi:GNAT family N-acetyltransferase [Leptotrichia shahii]|uniref:GNAT family N-acetyltransferase n=1 Tax=Leptotrichia shahii TaxID=157691 RepID=UPI0028D29AE4|nr:GNAT family N-acetyltransferase [Leptotrichia shahii]